MSSSRFAAMTALREWLPRGGSLPDEVWYAHHRGIRALAWVQVPVLLVVASIQGRSAGQAAFAAFWVGVLALAGSMPRSPQVVLASMTTLSLLTGTALLIHAFHGLIEVHFLFFVVIAVVAMYQQWTPYLIGLGYVVVHHGVLGLLMPTAVYNHHAALADPLRFAFIHGGFVLAESIACLAYWKATEQALDAEREQRARAEQVSGELTVANQEMSDLVAMVSHDLRAPLTVINGAAELALSSWTDLDEATRHSLVRKVGSAGQSLEEMLESTLTLSALDAQGLQSQPVAVKVDELVRSLLVDVLGSLADVRLDGLEPTTALVDRQQLTQIVTNLLTNAVKYGSPPFTVSGTASGNVVELVVSDSGDGVAPVFVSRLFDRYARSDDARRGDQRGTGLGLYIVRALVRANGGSVTYREAKPHGAEFVLHLLRAPRADEGTVVQLRDHRSDLLADAE